MRIPTEIKALVAAGNEAEDRGAFDEAAVAYTRALDLIDTSERELRGRVLMNLGRVAGLAGRPGEAVEYYGQSVAHFEGLRGEAVLQTAHAHLNIAAHLLSMTDREALRHIDTSLQLYRAYPFTSQTDIADALILRALIRAFCERALTETELREAWEAAKAVRPEDLVEAFVLQFAELFIVTSRATARPPESDVRAALLEWGRDCEPLQRFLAQR